MVIRPDEETRRLPVGDARSADARLAALAEAGRRAAASADLAEALSTITAAVRDAVEADVAVVRTLDPSGTALVAQSVSAASAAVCAELEASRVPAAEASVRERDDPARVPESTQRAAQMIGAATVLYLPVSEAGRVVATLELLRGRGAFNPFDRNLARLGANQLELALRALDHDGRTDGRGSSPLRQTALRLVGDALAASAEHDRGHEPVARLACEAARASGCLLWLAADDGIEPSAQHGVFTGADFASLRGLARDAFAHRASRITVVELPRDGASIVTLALGEPPLGALQLAFSADALPTNAELGALSSFGVRIAHALRLGDRARRLTSELDRTRALLGVVAQAIAELSLAHTLDTAVERVSALLGVDRVAIYLRTGRELRVAATRGVTGPHEQVAEALLELALGPFRGRGIAVVDHARGRAFAGVRDAAAAAGIEAAVGAALLAREEVIGLLAVYPEAGRALSEDEQALVTALAAQLAVAVENARLHEQAKQLGAELEEALFAERRAADQLRALYEISRSFAQSLSLDETLEAVARSVVESFDLDAAVIRMPDDKRDFLVARALHVADHRQEAVVRAILSRPQAMSAPPVQRLLTTAKPVLLDPRRARDLDTSHGLLAPFLEKGSTAAIVPIATSAEVLATLTLVSLDPSRRITQETVEATMSIASQAALAVDNARLYQQQKSFADTMQRSLLPRSRPELDGLELGEVYESSARVDVGGDVYDYLILPDGRLAVILGDVTGHGIEAAADMAMAKFVFRSLTREHPDPGSFLSSANEVVVGEIPAGKFITMLYVTVDPESGDVACASAGHPPPRLVGPDGSVVPLAGGGIPLGIDREQLYEVERRPFPAGSALVLYTDGVIESRRNSDLYGTERLDRLLSAQRHRSAAELARAIVDDCREFAGGALTDDCAVVVIKKTA